jgi:parallel beta-helix repeat protein
MVRAGWRAPSADSDTGDQVMHQFFTRALLVSSLAGAVASPSAWARGPLNPPAGPITSTYKTLSEVEPRTAINLVNTPGDVDSTFRITQSGSYYLTGNLSGEAARSCIEIAASNVTIDLMGFRILGSGASLDGIVVSGSQSNVTIRNGSVRTFGGDGIDVGLAANARLIDVTARNCDGVGVVAGAASVLTRVMVDSNLAGGIHALSSSVLDSCCANDNAVFGFQVNSGSTVARCSAGANAGDGFLLELGCRITDCSAFGNQRGIVTLNGCSVTGCTARGSSGDGITVASSCLVKDNACSSNGTGAGGGAGILATGSDNRIEGNNCVLADRGIDVNSGGNIIVRNTCSGNTTNWTFVANNYYGPIVDRTGILTLAVSGNAAGSALGSTDANANFSY